jgi:hypothetical protein
MKPRPSSQLRQRPDEIWIQEIYIASASEWWSNWQTPNTFEHVLRWQVPCVRGSVAAACKFGIERKNAAAAAVVVPADGIMCCAGCLSGRRVGLPLGRLACEYISNIDCTAVQQYCPSRLILFSLSATHLANGRPNWPPPHLRPFIPVGWIAARAGKW